MRVGMREVLPHFHFQGRLHNLAAYKWQFVCLGVLHVYISQPTGMGRGRQHLLRQHLRAPFVAMPLCFIQCRKAGAYELPVVRNRSLLAHDLLPFLALLAIIFDTHLYHNLWVMNSPLYLAGAQSAAKVNGQHGDPSQHSASATPHPLPRCPC